MSDVNKKTKEPKSKKNEESKDLIFLDDNLPPRLFIIPVNIRPVFPGIFTPILINNPDDVKVVEQVFEGDGVIGMCLSKNDAQTMTVKDIYSVGTACRIIRKINLPDGGVNIFISSIKRFKIKKTLSETGPIACMVEYLEEEEDDSFEVKALNRALISEMKEIAENNPLFSDENRINIVNIDPPGKVADFIASVLNLEKEEQQKILEETNIRRRMEKVLVFIKKEQELLRIQRKVQNEINERIEKNQREYFLKEELKQIQNELNGGKEGQSSDYIKFKEKIDALGFKGEIKETLDSELEKFNLMEPNSSEYIWSRNFLELVTLLPWNDEVNQNFDLSKAWEILEQDHYGLVDVKKRIMEFLSVRKLKNDSKGSILLLVGPPGVGKTSVGKSIAASMNKPFYRFSVGGMRDESEIKGHRRTYVGAMPGKIIEGLKITKSKSPVFMIDEIDKMGSSHNGDPASALLEVLDPEQNVNFRDTYLDLPFDISNVFFILTANSLDTIPEPLLDRAEVIRLSGYIDQEKFEIAKKYLIPKNLVKNGFSKNQVKYTKGALIRIAEEYARESGVRNFEKCLDKIHRKLVTENLTGIESDVSADTKSSEIKPENSSEEALKSFKKNKFTIDKDDLDKYLGKPVFDESEIKRASVPGTAIGLAWTSMGGDTLLIESISYPSDKGGMILTGQLGDVMKESAQIAMNWVKSFAIKNKIKDQKWFEKNTIHLHIPEGATPKDGPSAGITMATTFMSLIKNKKIKPNLAMTGELSLSGKVMPIGGLREKTVAAKRNGIKTILIPKANVRDLDDIPENVKDGIKFIPVSHISEVLEEVF